MRLIAYLRTSTITGTNGDSIDAQEDACRRWADSHGHEIVCVKKDEGISGGKDVDSRPGLAATLLAIELGDAEGLLVHNVDRLARELHVQEAALDRVWRASGAAFETFDGEIPRDDPDDPQRTFLRQVLGAAAQLERGMIAARLKRGRARKRQRGGYSGGSVVPFGQRVQGEGADAVLVPDEEAQKVIDKILELRLDGQTLQQVADRLNEEGVKGPRGGNWHVTSVNRVLARREPLT